MNKRIEQMKQRMNDCFENVIKRYVQQENKIQNVEIRFENNVTIMKNERIQRMHQFIQIVKIHKFAANFHNLM